MTASMSTILNSMMAKSPFESQSPVELTTIAGGTKP
jgi:hypothetical protein